MYKFFETLVKILETIIAIPLAIVGAVCMAPLVVICYMISIPIAVFEDIWFPVKIYKIEKKEEIEE